VNDAYSGVAVEVLDERIPGHRHEIERLRARNDLIVRDLHAAQLAELTGLRGVGERELAESPRWIHYPWRATLVRVLGPRGYRRLRLDRNRDKITESEQHRAGALTIGVLGASVGHQVAVGLALEGLFGAIRIADFDSIELSNLNRVPGSVLDYGLNKTVVAARRIAEIDPYLRIQTVPAGVAAAGAGSFAHGLDLLIEVCDSLEVKLAVREHAARLGIPVIMVTSDRGTLDVERFDLEPSRPPFHGLAEDLTSVSPARLTSAQNVPHVMRIVGADGLSARMAASMLEIGQSLTTWPHLAGDVLQAAACAVLAVRRFVRGDGPASGRLHIDIAGRLDELADPVRLPDLAPLPPPGPYRNLPEPESVAQRLVRAAQLAPSGGNCQPWRITADDHVITVELDEKQTTAMDVGFRASHVAVGAASQNLRIAAARHGVLGDLRLLPNGPGVAPAAVFTLGDRGDAELAGGYESMLGRVTNRNPADPARAIPDATLARLRAAAAGHGAALAVVAAPAALAEAAEILTDADRVRYLLPALHREMMRELRDPRVDSVDRGIDVRTLELGPAAAMLDIVRRADVMAELAESDGGRNLGARVGELVKSSPALVAVTVAGQSLRDYLRGGQAMQDVWIAAGDRGLAVQPIVPLFCFASDDAELRHIAGRHADRLSAGRRRLHALLGIEAGEHPAVLLRLGYAPAPSAISLRSRETARCGSATPAGG
jgi:molybdopterin/thiamine biosynthesis adenylyltransferase